MPLRKNDRRTSPHEEPMTEIRMSAASTNTTLNNTPRDSDFQVSNTPHPVYGYYSEQIPLQPPSTFRRPGPYDQHNRTLSDLITAESLASSPIDGQNGSPIPPFAPRANSSYSEPGTRNSSPYPSPYPASTPFVSTIPSFTPFNH